MSKQNQLLDDRNSMIKVAQRASVHINATGSIILSLSGNKSGKETHSFLLSSDMSVELGSGLVSAASGKLTSGNDVTVH